MLPRVSARHDFHSSVLIDVSDSHMSLNVPHLDRPPLERISGDGIKDIQKAHARPDDHLQLSVPVHVGEGR